MNLYLAMNDVLLNYSSPSELLGLFGYMIREAIGSLSRYVKLGTFTFITLYSS